MKTTILKISLLNLLAAAIIALPAVTRAQDATTPNAPAAPEQKSEAPAKHKKHDTMPFHGKISAVDDKAMTLKVGERTFEITKDTKITKDGKPATLADGVVGETVGGAYKKDAEGKLIATSIHFGGKADSEKKHKKKSDSETGISTNSVAH
jgi:hypothetical protein